MRFSYTKQAAVIEMLRRPEGATIVEIQWITGWQKHTINGMFNHTLKKRLGMNVVRVDGERRYRIDWTTARERAINRSSLGEYNRMIVHAQAQLAVKPMKHREGTKEAMVINMLRRHDGVTIAEIMDATGWQAHTVRGFFAGALKKKWGFQVSSQKVDGKRYYRILCQE